MQPGPEKTAVAVAVDAAVVTVVAVVAAVATIARPAGNQQNNSSFGVQHFLLHSNQNFNWACFRRTRSCCGKLPRTPRLFSCQLKSQRWKSLPTLWAIASTSFALAVRRSADISSPP